MYVMYFSVNDNQITLSKKVFSILGSMPTSLNKFNNDALNLGPTFRIDITNKFMMYLEVVSRGKDCLLTRKFQAAILSRYDVIAP